MLLMPPCLVSLAHDPPRFTSRWACCPPWACRACWPAKSLLMHERLPCTLGVTGATKRRLSQFSGCHIEVDTHDDCIEVYGDERWVLPAACCRSFILSLV